MHLAKYTITMHSKLELKRPEIGRT